MAGIDIGGNINRIAQSFTPQNNFTASNPLDLNAFNQAIQQSQGNFNQGQLQQQQLAQSLLAQSQGQGPNPAAAMLRQATDQNIQQSAGLVAAQKGINPALAARLAGQNAATMNQHAAGQAATMGAQQQLAAQGQLSGLYNNLAGQNLTNINNSAGATNTAINGVNQINAGVSAQNAAADQKTNSGLMSGIGGALTKYAGFAHGGVIPHFAGGGGVDASSAIAAQMMGAAGVPMWASGVDYSSKDAGATPASAVKGSPGEMNGLTTTGDLAADTETSGGMASAGGGDALGGLADVGMMAAAHGGQVPGYDDGGLIGTAMKLAPLALMALARGGGPVPGKARVGGDSSKNDTVPAMLSPGEIVIPRSKADDPEKAKKFVEHLKKKKDHGGFGKVLEAHRQLGESLKRLGAR